MTIDHYIEAVPVLWLSVLDRVDRAYVESDSIALTSLLAEGTDPPSHSRIGHRAFGAEILQSGLWDVDHVTQPCHPEFLTKLERLVQLPEFPL